METMNIALPDAMKAFVQDQVAEGGYSSVSEYVRELIRADQKRKTEQNLEELLLEGLEGKGTVLTEEWWEQFRSRLKERHRKGKRR